MPIHFIHASIKEQKFYTDRVYIHTSLPFPPRSHCFTHISLTTHQSINQNKFQEEKDKAHDFNQWPIAQHHLHAAALDAVQGT